MKTDFYEPWHPEVGQRVRVRLSGECNLPTRAGTPSAHMQPGHDVKFDGLIGTVTDRSLICDDDREFLDHYGHLYEVEFDIPVLIGNTVFQAEDLAAIEIEPIDE